MNDIRFLPSRARLSAPRHAEMSAGHAFCVVLACVAVLAAVLLISP